MRALLLLIFLTACGYHLGDQAIVNHYRTISVPFVQGDRDGRLTEAIVREIGRTGRLRYVSSGGQLCLKGEITGCHQENIGFEYDENLEGKRTDRIVPTEARLVYCVRFSVTSRQGTVIGPVEVTEEIAYDFDPIDNDDELAVFSVGQFVIYDQAQEIALTPLYDRLARKVVAYLNAAW